MLVQSPPFAKMVERLRFAANAESELWYLDSVECLRSPWNYVWMMTKLCDQFGRINLKWINGLDVIKCCHENQFYLDVREFNIL